MFKKFMKLIILMFILYTSTSLTMKTNSSDSHQNKHVSDKRPQSSKCKKKIKSKKSQEEKPTIMKLCSSFQRGNPQCSFDKCNQKFESIEDLLEHMYKEHTEKKLKQCLFPKCKKCFDSLSHLKGHLCKHFAEKYLFCPLCFRLFKWPKDLKKHIDMHGDKTHISPVSNLNVNRKKLQDPAQKTYIADYEDEAVYHLSETLLRDPEAPDDLD